MRLIKIMTEATQMVRGEIASPLARNDGGERARNDGGERACNDRGGGGVSLII